MNLYFLHVGRGTRTWTMRDNRQRGGMSTRATRMMMKTTRIRRTRMRTRGEDNKEDKDEGQQGGQQLQQGHGTRTWTMRDRGIL